MRGYDAIAVDGTVGPRRGGWICWLGEDVVIVYYSGGGDGSSSSIFGWLASICTVLCSNLCWFHADT